MKCPKCGFENPDDTYYCGKCATALRPEEEIPVSVTKTLQKATSELEIGSILAARYQITEILGRGGMGIVYKADDSKLKRSVALKFLPPELVRDEEARERFLVEAQAAAGLSHPNICTIYEIEEEEERHFISMEYVEGMNLGERIKSGPIERNEVLSLAIQVTEGLEAAHKKGIIHRDIKSANIMVTEKGRAKIMDFGLAKVAGGAFITKEAKTMGTLAYMSPEQAQGKKVDQRTDIWSLGVVLYEMLCGRVPFDGEQEASILYSIVHEEPRSLKEVKPDTPLPLQQVIAKALKKRPESRYQSAAEMLKDLRRYQESVIKEEAGVFNLRSFLRLIKKPQIAIPAVLIIIGTAVLAYWFFARKAKIRWAKEVLLPEMQELIDDWKGGINNFKAYNLALEAEKYIPNDPLLQKQISVCSSEISIKTTPPGADIYLKEYWKPESNWKYLGVSPLENIRVPRASFRCKIEKQGYEKAVVAFNTGGGRDPVTFELLGRNMTQIMDRKGTVPDGMVRVAGGKADVGPIVGDFFIDKYEVTNQQFKEFVDKGGYQKKDYWKQPFLKDEKVLTWEEAMAEFVDTTGRSGPAPWQAGDYPDGQDNYPVQGISWYEAAAYAEYVGKSLPTVWHWEVGGKTEVAHFIFIPLNNFGGIGPSPVGSHQGITTCGAYDMAGNVREWCWNETHKGRCLRGGAWNDAHYMFGMITQADPFDRSEKNGFRCVHYFDPDTIPEEAFQNPTQFFKIMPRDYYKEREENPVPDAVYQVYKDQFSYDKTELNATVEKRDERFDDWIRERISFDAAYGNERIPAYLFLPKNATRPFQTVIIFPGVGAKFFTSSEEYFDRWGLFYGSHIVKNGRAVLWPAYKGTFERQVNIDHRFDASTRQYSAWLIEMVKDFKRSIDYLETRPDIDSDNIAYYGASWGGQLAPIITAVEDRLKASIILGGGFSNWKNRSEADPLTYVSHVKIPTLMLHGKYDTSYGYERMAKPMFDLLGTPSEHKLLKVYDTDHWVPMNELIKESLNWLDRYLGPVKK